MIMLIFADERPKVMVTFYLEAGEEVVPGPSRGGLRWESRFSFPTIDQM
jgi:hypothetical protein